MCKQCAPTWRQLHYPITRNEPMKPLEKYMKKQDLGCQLNIWTGFYWSPSLRPEW